MRQKIPIPLGGLSDDLAFSEQAPGTTREAVNVRGLDPPSGRTRIAQRAGSTKFIADQVCSTKLDAILPITYDKPRVKYTQRTADFTTEWSVRVPPGNGAYSVVTDRQGNVFTIAVNGTVYKYNSAGQHVDTIVPPLPAGFSAVRVIRLDELDNLYIAGTVKSGQYQGYIWKYQLDQDQEGNSEYRIAWAWARESGIVDFDVRVGIMAVLNDGLSVPDDTCAVSVYGSLSSSKPIRLWGKKVPTPGNAIRINSVGDILVTCEPNAARGYQSTGDGSWGSEVIYWSPHDEYESDTRLHGWVDAKQVVNHADGDFIDLLEDRRFIATEETNELSPDNHLRYGQPGAIDATDVNAYADAPTDYEASRYLYNTKFIAGSSLSLPGPKFRVGVIGNFPSIQFDPAAVRAPEPGDPSPQAGDVTGSRLLIRPGLDPFKDASSSANPTSSGTNAAYNSFWVGHNPFDIGTDNDTGFGNGFCWFFAGVISDYSQPQVIFSTPRAINGGRLEYILTANVYFENGNWKYAAGEIGFYVERYDSSGTAVSYTTGHVAQQYWDTTGRGFFIFSFTHGGNDYAAGTTRNYHSTWRINGIAFKSIGRMDSRQTIGRSAPPYFRATIGGAGVMADVGITESSIPPVLLGVVQDVGGDQRPLYTYGFNGHLLETITLLHPDSTYANALDTVTDIDAGTWGPVQPVDSADLPPSTDFGGSSSGSIDPDGYTGDAAALRAYTKTATTVERFEGYLAHAWGSGDALPDAATSSKTGDFWDSHPFGDVRYPYGASGYNGYEDTATKILNQPTGIILKLAGGSGEVIWAETGSGIGYGVTLDDDDNPICIGPFEDATSVEVYIRKLVDNGPTVSLTGTGTWTTLSGTTLDESDTRLVRLASDSNGDAYWPSYDGYYDASVATPVLRKFDKDDGTELYSVILDDPVIPFSVSFPPSLPVYDDDTITGPEFAYLCTSGGPDQEFDTLYKIRLVTAVQDIADGETLRQTDLVTVGGGDIKVISDGSLSTPTGGSGALLERTPYVQAVQLFGEVFITDGQSYKVYNPRLGTVVDWVATDGGELPARGRILTDWRGRAIITRCADDPYEIYASELGNPYGWDRSPAAPSVTQAWSGRTTLVGRAPDIVNAFIPLTNDLALVGMDHSIYRITGDPAANGIADVMTDQVGVAFGNSWTKDLVGNVYVFGSRGGVQVLSSSGWVRLSERKIERRLQDLDLEEYQVRLVWDYRREGLLVLPVPWTIGGVKHKGWFWEAKTGSWWEDDWTDAGVQPSCACVTDGDNSDDRLVLFGCEDGYVRYVDEDAKDDDTALIDSRVLIGPLIPSGLDRNYRFSRPSIVLASDQDRCGFDLYASNAADTLGQPWASGIAIPGRSTFMPARTRGAAVYLRLRNNTAGERWALEDGTVEVTPAGVVR